MVRINGTSLLIVDDDEEQARDLGQVVNVTRILSSIQSGKEEPSEDAGRTISIGLCSWTLVSNLESSLSSSFPFALFKSK